MNAAVEEHTLTWEDDITYGDGPTDAPDNHVWRNGVLYDAETGEILGTVHEHEFHVDSVEAAEWVLERIGEREAAILARQEHLKAIVANYDAMQRADERELAALHGRFDPELTAFALGVLEAQGWRTKTLRTLFGSISFRTIPARLRVIDAAAALDWALAHIPECVRHTVNDRDVIAALQRFDGLGSVDPGEGIVELVPAGEQCFVKTNVRMAKA